MGTVDTFQKWPEQRGVCCWMATCLQDCESKCACSAFLVPGSRPQPTPEGEWIITAIMIMTCNQLCLETSGSLQAGTVGWKGAHVILLPSVTPGEKAWAMGKSLRAARVNELLPVSKITCLDEAGVFYCFLFKDNVFSVLSYVFKAVTWEGREGGSKEVSKPDI